MITIKQVKEVLDLCAEDLTEVMNGKYDKLSLGVYPYQVVIYKMTKDSVGMQFQYRKETMDEGRMRDEKIADKVGKK